MQVGEISVYIPGWSPEGSIRIDDLIKNLVKIQNQYGRRTLIRFDAGYNNVDMIVKPSKKISNTATVQEVKV